ncbi:MAG: two-component regulator propeller domain-containing protein [Bacteroidota bacterium]
MIHKKILLFTLLGFCCLASFAQEKTIMLKHLTSDDGLSDNRVTSVLRDKSGFIWIGTKDGLNRFDGREFYAFKHIDNDSSSLCGNKITCITYDADSLLWIGTSSSGLCAYNFRTGKFKSYNKGNADLNSNGVNAIAFDEKENKLWIAFTNAGLQTFNLKTSRIENTPNEFSLKAINDIALKGNEIFVGAIGTSLLKFKSQTVENYAGGRLPTVNKIHIDTDNNIWCGVWNNALYQFDYNANYIAHYIFDGKKELDFSNDEILDIAEDRNNILWCAGKYSGIHFFDTGKKMFLNGYQLSEKITSRINCIYKDDNDRMWIGSENGLYLYSPLQNQFDAIRMPVPEGIATCKVYGRIITKGGKEFVVSACGLFYKNKTDFNYSYKEVIYQNEKQQLISIFKNDKDEVFIGTQKTIFKVDTNSLVFGLIQSNKVNRANIFYSVNGSRVNDIAQIIHNGDTLLAASYYGYHLSLIQENRQNIFKLAPIQYRKEDFYENLTRKIFMDSKNNFWVCGASKGISQFNISDSVKFSDFNFSDTTVNIVRYRINTWANKKSGPIVAVNDVFDIAENMDGSYWLSTQGNGLLKFFPGNDTLPFVSYAGEYKSLHGIAKSDEENLWMISSNGLLHYNIKENRYKLYNKKNGITETIGGYFFKVPLPELNVGFDGGFFSFNPASLLKDTEKPQPMITHLWVMDATCDSLLNSPIQLTHDKNFLKFYVSSNCFSSNDQVTYFYYLEGIDHGWRSNQNNPLITYTNLPHGNFKLQVKAVNGDGLESDIMMLPISIIPPYYKTYWFYTALLLLIVGAIYLLYRNRISQILKLQEVRNKIARDLHDDIGSTLGSINLYSQIASSKIKQDKMVEVKPILEKIEKSSKEIIEKTGDAVWAVKASNDTLESLILRMEGYAASLLGTAGIQFNIKYDENLLHTKLEMDERKNVFLIYKEAIHNIVKYANATEVTISIRKNGEQLIINIADNGVGFNSKEINPYNGNGLRNMKSRVEDIKGSLQVTSAEGKGTAIEIVI